MEFRRLQRKDIEGVCLLQWEVFNKKKDPGYWYWKFYQNPAGEHMIIVAVDKNKIVAMLGSIPVKVKMGANMILSSQGVDIAISPEYRNTTLFFQLERASRELCSKNGIDFNYAFSIKETHLLFTKFASFKGICPILNLTKIINPTPYLQQKLKTRYFAESIGFIGKHIIKIAAKKRPIIPEGFKIVEDPQVDYRFDEFWQKESKHYEISVVRDSRYLKWRYLENPEPYKFISVEQNQSIKGFVILKCSNVEVKRGKIVDIMVESEQENILDLLLIASINYFIEKGVDAITCWMFEHWPVFQGLKKRGFITRKTPHGLIIRSLAPIPDFQDGYLKDKSRWYMTMSDSDYV
jgi:hypothetical protein